MSDFGHFLRGCLCFPDPKHDLSGTAIYADQLGWFWGVNVGIYGMHGVSGDVELNTTIAIQAPLDHELFSLCGFTRVVYTKCTNISYNQNIFAHPTVARSEQLGPVTSRSHCEVSLAGRRHRRTVRDQA